MCRKQWASIPRLPGAECPCNSGAFDCGAGSCITLTLSRSCSGLLAHVCRASLAHFAHACHHTSDSMHASLPARRLYPLNQRDMPLERKQLDFGPLLPANVAIDNPSRDYTPPQVGSHVLS